MLAVITGIPGSGKTTVSNKALEELERQGVKYELVTYGTVMAEIAIQTGLVKDRDEMRKLPTDKQKEIQKEAAKKIHEQAEKGNVLLDTHCTINTPRGYLPGLPADILTILGPDIILLVEVSTEDIQLRRESDKSRARDAESLESMATHQEVNRMIGSAYSVISGATIKLINNPQGKLELAVDEMVDTLK